VDRLCEGEHPIELSLRPEKTVQYLKESIERGYVVYNRLRVLDTAELTQIDQRVRHQLHAIVPVLDAFKA
jgi:ribosome biogenesis GTPase A